MTHRHSFTVDSACDCGIMISELIKSLTEDVNTYRRLAERNHKANLMPCPQCGYKQLEIKPLAANREGGK